MTNAWLMGRRAPELPRVRLRGSYGGLGSGCATGTLKGAAGAVLTPLGSQPVQRGL